MNKSNKTNWLVSNILPSTGLYVLTGSNKGDVYSALPKICAPIHLQGDIYVRKEDNAASLYEWISRNGQDIKLYVILNNFDGSDILYSYREDVRSFNDVAERQGVCILLVHIEPENSEQGAYAPYIDGVITVEKVNDLGIMLDVDLLWEGSCKVYL